MAPSLVSCVLLVKLFKLPVSLFPHWKNGDKKFLPCRIIVRIKGDDAHKTLRTVSGI